MADSTNLVRGREYRRVSLDRSGRRKSNEQQGADNARVAPRFGITIVGEPYEDVGSASDYSLKIRDDFERLIEDLRRDRFDAEFLILWESSRGSRQIGEWVTLIELLKLRHIKVLVTTHDRTYDPHNERDERSLLEDAVTSQYESRLTSKRIRRDHADNAAKGRPHAAIRWGYRRVYDPKTGHLLGEEIVEDEATLYRELMDRIVAGHSLYSIRRDWEARGIRTRGGRLFSHTVLRQMAMNEAYIGVRIHAPGANGKRGPRFEMIRSEAVWEPVVSKTTFLAVQKILTAPERKTARPGRGVHLLSMIVRCDVCGAGLTVNFTRGSAGRYRCRDMGHVTVAQAELDNLAEKAIVAFLANPVMYGLLPRDDEKADAELGAVREELAAVRLQLRQLAAGVAALKVSVELASQAEPGLRRRAGELEEREREILTPSVVLSAIPPGPDAARRWGEALMPARRTVAAELLRPEWLGEWRVARLPSPGAKGVPVQDRVRRRKR